MRTSTYLFVVAAIIAIYIYFSLRDQKRKTDSDISVNDDIKSGKIKVYLPFYAEDVSGKLTRCKCGCTEKEEVKEKKQTKSKSKTPKKS